jgi:DNA-binding NtrC family response regulator
MSPATYRMAQVVLVGKDWKTRALLRAQLLEEGVAVEAYESLQDAHQGLVLSLPVLLVADLTVSDDLSADIRSLADWGVRVPTWILASRSPQAAVQLEGHNFERVFYRPIDLGQLVSLIKRRVPAGN